MQTSSAKVMACDVYYAALKDSEGRVSQLVSGPYLRYHDAWYATRDSSERTGRKHVIVRQVVDVVEIE